MEQIQKQHERSVGDAFISWLNTRDGSLFSFKNRGDEAPDLIYEFDDHCQGIEIVACYYGQDEALMQWQNARQRPNAPAEWEGTNFNDALRTNIELNIAKKCAKAYGNNCILLVSVRPGLTTIPKMHEILSKVVLPAEITFSGIYVAGEFPFGIDAKGGYYAWQLSGPELAKAQ